MDTEDNKTEWPDPTPEMVKSDEFNAVWDLIKTWDINVPGVNNIGSYSMATGNHVRAILDSIKGSRSTTIREIVKKLKYDSLGSKTRIELIKKLDSLINNTFL